MPRSLQEILDSSDELAKRFEDYEPTEADRRPVEPMHRARAAALARAAAEAEVAGAVAEMRSVSYSWATIGSVLGTSGEAVRQRYGDVQSAGGPSPRSVPPRESDAPPAGHAVENVGYQRAFEKIQRAVSTPRRPTRSAATAAKAPAAKVPAAKSAKSGLKSGLAAKADVKAAGKAAKADAKARLSAR